MSDPVHPPAGGSDASMDDLVRALPLPPPPRAVRRAAAIASALERFGPAGTPQTATRPAPAPRLPAWWQSGRTQVAALASVALVALLAVPMALDHPDTPAASPERVPTASAPEVLPERDGPNRSAASPEADLRPTAVLARSRPSAPAAAVPTAAAEASAAEGVAAALSAPPPAPAAPAPASIVAAEALAAAPASAQRASAAEDDSANVVVTGSRMSRQATAASRRGDWNACTLADPEQSLRGCGRLIWTGRGPAGAAGVQVADGLARGWRGDFDGALAAFDRAIALQPRLGIAYLNRALTRERLGASDEALSDLDRAVRFDPSARSYYARARARRDGGDMRGARADEDRAVDLDPDYARLIND